MSFSLDNYVDLLCNKTDHLLKNEQGSRYLWFPQYNYSERDENYGKTPQQSKKKNVFSIPNLPEPTKKQLAQYLITLTLLKQAFKSATIPPNAPQRPPREEQRPTK